MMAANGNESAYAFLRALYPIIDFFDAVADGDEEMPRERVEQALLLSMVVLPRNEFYRAFFSDLNPVIATAIYNWCVSTDFEREGGEYEKQIAFIARSSYIDVVTTVAHITGGAAHGRAVCKKARLHTHNEGWAEYLDALRREEKARG